jgi:two-component system KDP operon response regulator KdpE
MRSRFAKQKITTVLTHRHILREIWGSKSEEHRQYPRVYVTHLRQKIESDPATPMLIKTEPGIGYRVVSNEAA